MAITWTEKTYNSETRCYNSEPKTYTSHEGLVVSAPYTLHSVRIMSDVWADFRCVKVWDATEQKAIRVDLSNTEFDVKTGVSTIDAPAEIIAEVARQEAEAIAKQAAYEKASREAAARKAAEDAFNFPQKGMIMQVSNPRSRKVAPGTVGVVFWLDDFRNPSRVGLGTGGKDASGRYSKVVFVNAAYLKNTAVTGPDYAAYGAC